MTINLDEQILPCYKPAFYNESRFLVLRGGAGSGKSVFAAQKIIARCLAESGHRFLIMRKVDRTIKDSVYQLCKDVLRGWSLIDKCGVNKSEMRITIPSADGGASELIFKGLDEPDKLKSIVGISGIWMEEADAFTIEDFKELNRRLRDEAPGYKQFIITFNPVSDKHWLKARFFDIKSDDITTLHTTYKDNPYLSKEYIRDVLEAEKDENAYRIYTLGEWGQIKTGMEFFTRFKRSKHVRSLKADEGKWLVVARDFNNLPYMTAIIIQGDAYSVKVIDEVCAAPPRNTIEDSVDQIYERYPHIKAVVETGDPSGKANVARKTKAEAKSYYAQVKSCWQEKRVSVMDKVPRSAPPLAVRKSAYTKILSGDAGIEFVIDPKCKNLINDIETLQQDVSGGWVKRKVKDKKTGATYEESGHCADALTYFLAVQYPHLFKGRKNYGMLAG